MSLMTPTVGRKVWYWPTDNEKAGTYGMQQFGTPPQPLDATVLCVWGDRCVNLEVIDHNGKHFVRTSATLLQEGEVPPTNPETGRPWGGYCEWMPYQKGQAAKADAAERQRADVGTTGDKA